MSEKISASTQAYLINDAIARAVMGGIGQLSELELLAILLRNAGERRAHDKAVKLLRAFASLVDCSPPIWRRSQHQE